MMNTPLRMHRQSGLSMVELLVALTVGLLLLAGLTLIFVNSSRASRELQQTAQQIENGRYATDVLTQDLRLAGYYGHFHELPTPPAGLPDPCTTDAAVLQTALTLPVQGYRAATLAVAPNLGGHCAALLTAANLRAGSDVLVVRRAETMVRPDANQGEVFLQASASTAKIRTGDGNAMAVFAAADTPPLLHDGSAPAPVRKLHTHVYFVAPCSNGSGANGVCQAGDDTIPTLKRLELRLARHATTGNPVPDTLAMYITPLVEGIEYLKIEYGIDDLPNAVNAETGLVGNAMVDSYVAAPGSTTVWSQAIAARVFVLARNTQPTSDFVDDKTYNLGVAVAGPFNDRFRRHVYTASARMMNASGRREIP